METQVQNQPESTETENPEFEILSPEETPDVVKRGRSVYPWEKVQPGGSFRYKVPPDEDVVKRAASISTSGHNWARRNSVRVHGEAMRVSIETDSEARTILVRLLPAPERTEKYTAPDHTGFPEGFPGAEALAKFEITTLEALREYARKHPDMTGIPGIGAATSAKIEALLNGD